MEINSEIKLPANILQQIDEIMNIEECYNEYIRDLVSDGIMDIEECYNEYIHDLVSDEIENNQEGLKNGL